MHRSHKLLFAQRASNYYGIRNDSYDSISWQAYRIPSFPESFISCHDDVIKWKHFPRYWPFVRGIHRSPVNSPHKGQWRGALMYSLICAYINAWVNKSEAGDLRRQQTDVNRNSLQRIPQEIRTLLVVQYLPHINAQPQLTCVDCNTEPDWWLQYCQLSMGHGLQLAGATLLWLTGLNIDEGSLIGNGIGVTCYPNGPEAGRETGWGSEFVPLKKRKVGSFIPLHKISRTPWCFGMRTFLKQYGCYASATIWYTDQQYCSEVINNLPQIPLIFCNYAVRSCGTWRRGPGQSPCNVMSISDLELYVTETSTGVCDPVTG